MFRTLSCKQCDKTSIPFENKGGVHLTWDLPYSFCSECAAKKTSKYSLYFCCYECFLEYLKKDEIEDWFKKLADDHQRCWDTMDEKVAAYKEKHNIPKQGE